MAPKSLVVAALLLVVAAGQGAEADTRAGAGATASTSVLITGKVPCAVGTSINVVTVPAFPNAEVQLLCGGQVVAGATSDVTGAFLVSLSGVAPNLLAALTGNQCKLVVTTPLGACNQALAGATGTLTAPLKLLGASTGSGSDPLGGLGGIIGLVGQIIGGIVGGIVNLVPGTFSLV